MPDLTIETAWTCASNVDTWFVNVPSSSGKGNHSVRYGELDPEDQLKQGCQYGFTCTCRGFTYRGVCKHVKAEKERLCRWNAELEPNALVNQAEDGEPRCPECGGPVHAFKVGV